MFLFYFILVGSELDNRTNQIQPKFSHSQKSQKKNPKIIPADQ